MTENGLKKENLQKEKKKLYKNWKLYASSLGIIVIGLGVGLGIGLGIRTNNTETNIELTDQDIVKAINGTNYQLTVNADDEVSLILKYTDNIFIQNQLTGEIKSAFKTNSFKFSKITIDDRDLQNSDLENSSLITTQINYSYGSMTNQKTNLTIKVAGFRKQQIVDEINSVKDYQKEVKVNSNVNDITITAEFIKENLNSEIKQAFNDTAFIYKKLTINNDDLQNSNLSVTGTFEAEINYDYGIIKNQKTKIIINVIIDSKQISEEINKLNYGITITNDSTAQNIINQINTKDAKFIKGPLTGDIAKAFNADIFTFNKITVNEHDLIDQDLTENSFIYAKINYNYGEIFEEEANLTINTVDIIFDQWITNSINHINYKVKTMKGNSAQSISDQINAEFIQEQLIGDIAKAFNADAFKFIGVIVNANRDALTDQDLAETKNIETKIRYRYGEITTELQTSLTIMVS